MNPAPPVTRRRSNDRVSVMSADQAGDGWRQPTGRVVLGSHLGRTKEGRHRARVRPVAVIDRAVEIAVRDVVVEHVGDLELAATGWVEVLDDLEDVRAEEVDADRDQVALWHIRLLLEPDDASLGVELGDAEAFGV